MIFFILFSFILYVNKVVIASRGNQKYATDSIIQGVAIFFPAYSVLGHEMFPLLVQLDDFQGMYRLCDVLGGDTRSKPET